MQFTAMAPRLSGLQRQVLHLYRGALRLAHQHNPPDRAEVLRYTRQEFERYRHVDRKSYQLIEHLIRKGKRQMDMLQDPAVTAVHLQEPQRP